MAEGMTDAGARRPRRGSRPRDRGGEPRDAKSIPQLKRHGVVRGFPAIEIVSADELEAIHRASLRVLEEIGMDFTLPEARELLKKAGAKVEGERVRFDRGMVEELIRSAPP